MHEHQTSTLPNRTLPRLNQKAMKGLEFKLKQGRYRPHLRIASTSWCKQPLLCRRRQSIVYLLGIYRCTCSLGVTASSASWPKYAYSRLSTCIDVSARCPTSPICVRAYSCMCGREHAQAIALKMREDKRSAAEFRKSKRNIVNPAAFVRLLQRCQ